MRAFIRLAATLAASVLLLSACGVQEQGSSGPGYKEIKSMVLDILQTEEAQQSIKEASSKTQGMLGTAQVEQVELAVKDYLINQDEHQLLRDIVSDPKFAGEFAKAVQKETKELHKDLIKDPEYQTAMLDLMKNPEFEEMIMDVMKGAQYRQQMMTVMQDSIESPLFRQELMKLFKKVLEEEAQPKKKQNGGSNGGGGEGGGGGQ